MAATTSSGMGTMTAEGFLTAYLTKLRKYYDPNARSAKWTNLVRHILYEMGTERGYWVGCEKFLYNGKQVSDGERLTIDFTFWPQRDVAAVRIDDQPRVAIEHENGSTYDANLVDFARVCRIASRLRVLIGYGMNRSNAEAQAEQLVRFYKAHEIEQLPEGETLIVISDETAPTANRFAWALKGNNLDQWRQLRSGTS